MPSLLFSFFLGLITNRRRGCLAAINQSTRATWLLVPSLINNPISPTHSAQYIFKISIRFYVDRAGREAEIRKALASTLSQIFSFRSLISAYNSIITYTFFSAFCCWQFLRIFFVFTVVRFPFPVLPNSCCIEVSGSSLRVLMTKPNLTKPNSISILRTVFAVHGKFHFGHVC